MAPIGPKRSGSAGRLGGARRPPLWRGRAGGAPPRWPAGKAPWKAALGAACVVAVFVRALVGPPAAGPAGAGAPAHPARQLAANPCKQVFAPTCLALARQARPAVFWDADGAFDDAQGALDDDGGGGGGPAPACLEALENGERVKTDVAHPEYAAGLCAAAGLTDAERRAGRPGACHRRCRPSKRVTYPLAHEGAGGQQVRARARAARRGEGPAGWADAG